jgi:NADH-quinone oxidoreductase subunit J
VQVIVYAGAIVVLFLFVIMLLGVDKAEDLQTDPLVGQRPIALLASLAGLVLLILVLVGGDSAATGARGLTEAIDESVPNVNQLGEVLFTQYVLAFEITAVLLTIAVVGAVVLARRQPAEDAEEVDA